MPANKQGKSSDLEERRIAQAEEIAAALAHVRLFPGMYFSTSDLSHVQVFATGFILACRMSELDITEHENEIWAERGWKAYDSRERISKMKEARMLEKQIIAEWLGVLILSLQRTYNISAEQVLEIHKGVRERSTNQQFIQLIDDLESAMSISSL